MRLMFDVDGRKWCSKCQQYQHPNNFHKDNSNKHRLAYWCKACCSINGAKHHARRMREVPEYRAKSTARHVKRRFGMSLEEYESKWKAQTYCLICYEKLLGGYQTHLDHNHKTGNIRAFLCTNCNRGLGHFKDSVGLMQSAILYLESHT